MTTEVSVMREIQLAATERGARLWRNNVAQAWVGTLMHKHQNGVITLSNARPLHAGLAVGSADLIGINRFGGFLSIEVKARGGRLTADQSAWLDMVRRMGGVAGVCRSVEDLEGLL